jgi:hypothetical protein
MCVQMGEEARAPSPSGAAGWDIGGYSNPPRVRLVGIQELTLVDLDAVAGGKLAKASGLLLEACRHGEHYASATVVA